MIIHLISSPRNLSTAMMYSFYHRGDTQVIDEPFYGYYLKITGKDHPGKEQILSSMSSDLEELIGQFQDPVGKRHLFIKDMAHHLIDMSMSFLIDHQCVILIRDPKQLIASFAQVIAAPEMADVGIQRQWEIFEELRSVGKDVLVIDSGDLLKDPELFMTTFCKRLGITQTNMTEWPSGSIPADGVWAKYWYENIHKSTGFAPQKTSNRPLPQHCEVLYQESLPYYEEFSKYALKP